MTPTGWKVKSDMDDKGSKRRRICFLKKTTVKLSFLTRTLIIWMKLRIKLKRKAESYFEEVCTHTEILIFENYLERFLYEKRERAC